MTPLFKSMPLRSVIHWIGLSIALAVSLAGPAGFVYSTWQDRSQNLALRSEISAARLAKYAYAHGSLWAYHRVRIAELIELPQQAGAPIRQRILTASGKVVLEEGSVLAAPIVRSSAPLVVQGETIGTVITESSLASSGWAFAGALLLSGLLGFAAYFAVRMLPIRVLDRTLGELQAAQDRLAKNNSVLTDLNTNLEDRVQQRTERLLNQQGVLSTLIKSEEQRYGTIGEFAMSLTTVTAATLGVERVGVRLFNADRDALTCIDLYDAASVSHTSDAKLVAADFPAYIEALLKDEVIAADTALTDPRTRELADTYLKPNGITAVLHVPVVHNGRVEGMVGIERVGTTTIWSAEQRLFAAAIANLIALAIERQERIRADVDLREANKTVLAANQAKSMFLANMSHEIRTPMNGVFGMTDLLMRTELTQRQERLVNTINQSAKSLLTIINDILDVSRIEAGKVELDRNDFDLRQCIEDTVDVLAETAQKKGLDLTLFIAPEVPSSVAGDVGRVRQVCTNIISNAVKFTNAGAVAVAVNCPQQSVGIAHIEIEVRDSGIGIPADVQDRLFLPFEQADTSISRRFGGTGLGLAITKHLVEMMGGDIKLVSAIGDGSAFTIRLPLALGAPTTGVQSALPTSLLGARILILDDRAANREIIASYLSESGAETSCVETPAAALQALRDAKRQSRPFALAMIDMVLPGSSGLDVADMIRAEAAIADVRLIMVTSLSWKGDMQAAREHGFQAFLTKPVRRKDLFDAAARALAKIDRDAAQSGNLSPQVVKIANRHRAASRVLVAEDNLVNVEVAKEYLANLNCTITLAGNGVEAVTAFLEPRFDIILMDCQMPEMDGLAATRRIRETEKSLGMPRTTIVAVTANAYEEDRARCLAAGMDDYLTKPFTEEQLERMLSKWIKQTLPDGGISESASTTDRIVATTAPEPLPTTGGASSLDEGVLGSLTSRHPALLARLIDTYLGITPELVSQLVLAATNNDRDVVRTTAHSLKSSSANMGAMQLAKLCGELEGLLKASQEGDVTTLCLIHATQISRELQAVTIELTAMAKSLREATRTPDIKPAIAHAG
jgi:signal transduction histidine kinase/DNA-binding response OmpR family regulator/HPt (histidine-containing phosphotransfer) domain-containing protein